MGGIIENGTDEIDPFDLRPLCLTGYLELNGTLTFLLNSISMAFYRG